MYPAKFEYHRASSLADAVDLIGSLPAGSKLIAGGQTLLPLLKLRLLTPPVLIDIGKLPEAREIEVGAKQIHIGALCRHIDIARSVVAGVSPLIGECARSLADPQVRNLGTVGGSLAEADPSGDWPTVLATLQATVVCLGPRGERRIGVREFLREPFAPALEAGELIRRVEIPTPTADTFGAYASVKRSASAYPTASCAAVLRIEGGVIQDASVGLACMGLTPIVVDACRSAAAGRTPTDSLLDDLAALVVAAVEPVEDARGSVAYKKHLAGALAKRAIGRALHRWRGEDPGRSHDYYGL